MCKPASMVVTKDRVYWSRTTDSHTEIIREYGLADNQDAALIKHVAVEISPPNGMYAVPLDNWEFTVDQDLLPDWWDAEDAERRVRAQLPAWAGAKLVVAGQIRDCVRDGEVIVSVLPGGTIKRVDGDTIECVYGGTIKRVDGGTVQYYLAPPLAILQGDTAVLIDRSVFPPKCYVGRQTKS